MGYGAAARSLIHTKLNRPRVAAQLVDRPRLGALLDVILLANHLLHEAATVAAFGAVD